MRDWLGNEFGEGSQVLYATASGTASGNICLAKVVEIKEGGAVVVQPLQDSTNSRDTSSTHYYDKRTGKEISRHEAYGDWVAGHYLDAAGKRVESTWPAYQYRQKTYVPGHYEGGIGEENFERREIAKPARRVTLGKGSAALRTMLAIPVTVGV